MSLDIKKKKNKGGKASVDWEWTTALDKTWNEH